MELNLPWTFVNHDAWPGWGMVVAPVCVCVEGVVFFGVTGRDQMEVVTWSAGRRKGSRVGNRK